MEPEKEGGRKLRIVQLCAVDFTMRQFIAPLALALSADGHQVVCACTPGIHWEELRAMGLRLHAVSIARSGNPIRAARSVLRIARWLRRARPDVLHVHTPVASMIGRLAGALAGVPVVVYTAHGFYFHDRMPAIRRLPHIALERVFGWLCHYLFCVSAEDLSTAKRLGIGPRHGRFHTPNGADHCRFDPAAIPEGTRERIRDEFGIPADARVVAIMGRLVREKGYFEFFRAACALAPRYPGAHFLAIGDTVASEHDDAKAEILRMAQAPELKGRVHFAGLRSDVPELLAASDIFCLPSYREGMPVSIVEAMLMGLPTVTTRIRGCRELIEDGRFGLLVKPGDAAELERALEQLLGDESATLVLGREAMLHARAHLTQDRAMERVVHLYRRIARERFG